ILQVVTHFDFGGAENHVRELCNELTVQEHEVYLVGQPGRQVKLMKPVIMLKYNCAIAGIIMGMLCLGSSMLCAQHSLFDSLYAKGIADAGSNNEKAEKNLSAMQGFAELDNIQQAKVNYLKSKIYWGSKNFRDEHVSNIDNSLNYEVGVHAIMHGEASKGLDILYSYLNGTPGKGDSDTLSDYLNIIISEGLRITGEFEKGRDILLHVLRNPNITPYCKAYAYNRLAAIYDALLYNSNQQRIDSVVKYSELSMEISMSKGYIYLLALSQNELGAVYRLKGEDYKISEQYCTEAFKNFYDSGYFRNVMNVAIVLSDLYLRRQNFEGALDICTGVLGIIDIIGNEDIYSRIYLQLSKVYALTYNYREAYEYLTIGRLLEKQQFIIITNRRIDEMSAKYNLAIKNAQLAESEFRMTMQKRRFIYIALLLFIAICVLAFGVALLNIRRKNLKQKVLLEMAEKEKINMMYDFKNQELLQSLSTNLAKNEALRMLKKEILKGGEKQHLLGVINAQVDSLHTWNNILNEFQRTYPDFTPKLTIAHKDLSKNDVKLCVLVRLKLTSKQIAEVMGVSESSVNKARQRLRKKLGLKAAFDIRDYLLQFS
ncbi:MAG TPA: hypothetical protein PKU86_07265, partial [Bacteroidales bacterium]|nr:hypothetical protein [Bacteroidales bacterium]